MAANKVIPAFVLGAVVGGAIAYIGFANPPGDALTGAVAPAERYRAEQASSDDIQLGDQGIQRLMQTDTFDRLIRDESFRDLAASAQFADLAANAQFADLMANAQFARLLANAMAPSSRIAIAGSGITASSCRICSSFM